MVNHSYSLYLFSKIVIILYWKWYGYFEILHLNINIICFVSNRKKYKELVNFEKVNRSKDFCLNGLNSIH